MTRLVLGLLVILSSMLYAQVDHPDQYITLGIGSENYYTTLIAENTINDNFLIVAIKEDGPYTDIICRTVTPAGTVNPAYTLADNQNHIRAIDLVWHPLANRYMVAFYDGVNVSVRNIQANGKPLGGLKKVTTYNNNALQLSAADKKRFVLFLSRDDKLTAISLRKNGKIFKSEKTLVDLSSGSYQNPSFRIANAVMNKEKESLAYFVFNHKLQRGATISTISVDHKLNVKNVRELTSFSNAENSGVFSADYNPENRSHTVAFGSKFFSYSDAVSKINKIVSMSDTEWILKVRYDPFSKTFVLLSYYAWENPPSDQGTRIYMRKFKTTQALFFLRNTLYTHTGNEINGSSINIAYNWLGNYLLSYAPENPSQGGLKGIIFD